MLEDILRSVPPDTLAHVLQQNQHIVLATLHKFKAYRSFGQALNDAQQLNLSNNLGKLNDFFKSDDGKAVVDMFGSEFIKFCA